MPSVLNLLPNAVSQGSTQIFLTTVASPAPAAPTSPLTVQASWSSTTTIVIDSWAPIWGPVMPQVGDAAVILTDDQRNFRCIWWGSGEPRETAARIFAINPYTLGPGLSQVPFDSVTFDSGANADISQGTYTVPFAGIYDVGGQVTFTAPSGDVQAVLSIYVNGEEYSRGDSVSPAIGGGFLLAQPGYDPTGQTASDAALQAALYAAGTSPLEPRVVIPYGDVCKVTTGFINIPAGVELTIDGTLDASAVSTSNTNVLQSIGSTVGSALSLAANCPAGQNYCQVSGTSPSDGTICLLSSTALWNSYLPTVPVLGSNQMIGEYVVVRTPQATLSASANIGATTLKLSNTQGDSRDSYFPIGAPITIGSDTNVTFTGISTSSTTITMTGVSGVGATHAVGTSVGLTSGYVAFQRGVSAMIGGGYNTADSATLQPCTFNDGVAVTGTGTIKGPGQGGLGTTAIYLDRCRRVRCSHGLLIDGFDYAGIELFDVLESTIDGPAIHGERSTTPAFYGISLWCACQDVTIIGGVGRDVRHAISFVSTASRPGITRRCGGIGCHAELCTATGFDFHMASEEVFMDSFTAYDCHDQGLQFRCPSGRASGVVKRPGGAGVWLRNQSTQPNNYDIDVLVEDPGSQGILLEPDLDFNTTLGQSLTNSFTGSVTVGSTTGFASSGYIAIWDSPASEICHYTSITPTTFVVDARGQLGTSAASHSSGLIVTQANTGTGATTDQIKIRGTVLRGSTEESVIIFTADNVRFVNVDVDVQVKDSTSAAEAIEINNVDYGYVKAVIYNQPLATKGVQIINCTCVEVKATVNYASAGSSSAISLERSSSLIQVVDPIAPNAATGVIADSTCTDCCAILGTGLIGTTTDVSFPSGKGNAISRPVTV